MRLITGTCGSLARENPRDGPPHFRGYARRFSPCPAQRNGAELPPVPPIPAQRRDVAAALPVPAQGSDAELSPEAAQAERVPRVGKEEVEGGQGEGAKGRDVAEEGGSSGEGGGGGEGGSLWGGETGGAVMGGIGGRTGKVTHGFGEVREGEEVREEVLEGEKVRDGEEVNEDGDGEECEVVCVGECGGGEGKCEEEKMM
ncbi:unnamed protein product [Closterium sp. NIES-65]|nr:unnamed protein product [Closterium sp. NIES-65]